MIDHKDIGVGVGVLAAILGGLQWLVTRGAAIGKLLSEIEALRRDVESLRHEVRSITDKCTRLGHGEQGMILTRRQHPREDDDS
jgi:hypothetical protein